MLFSELESLLKSSESKSLLDVLLASAPFGIIITGAPDGKILGFSEFAARFLGRCRSDVEGRSTTAPEDGLPIYDMSGRRLPPGERPMTRALLGETTTEFQCAVEAADGARILVAINAAPIRNSCQEVIGAMGAFVDLRASKVLEQSLREAIAQRDGALAECETLYRELTHRVKNHLQIMSGLVSIDARNPELSAGDLGELTKGRLQTLSAVYDSMTQAGVGASVGASAFIEQVCRSYASGSMRLETRVAPPNLTLTSEQAGPVGMLINEAVSNAVKHAFQGRNGRIWVTLRRLEPGRLRLEVGDDGAGWRPRDAGRMSHGMELMRLLARQLHGKLELSGRPGGGALVSSELSEDESPHAPRAASIGKN